MTDDKAELSAGANSETVDVGSPNEPSNSVPRQSVPANSTRRFKAKPVTADPMVWGAGPEIVKSPSSMKELRSHNSKIERTNASLTAKIELLESNLSELTVQLDKPRSRRLAIHR